MAASYVDFVLREHAELIDKSIEELKNNLANRGAVTNYDAYCVMLGKIEGLRDAYELCQEAIRKVNAS